MAVRPHVLAQMKKVVEHGRMSHAYLFEGNRGTGKHETALWLAKTLFCQHKENGEPCNQCTDCRRIDQGEHLNVQVITPIGQTIKVAQIRELQAEFAKSGFEKKLRIFIIQEADKMNASAANSLLKFLEDPSGNSLAILETTTIGKILPTIQSRCQIIHFSPLSSKLLSEKLQNIGLDTSSADLLANVTNSYEKAVEISQNEWFNGAKEAVLQWFSYLQKREPQAFIYVQKKLVAQAKEKDQQVLIFSMLSYFMQEKRDQALKVGRSPQEMNRQLELVLQAQQKLTSNVAFQGAAEQLVLRILNK